MKKLILLGTVIAGALLLTACKEEWEEKVMTHDWYKEHPTETAKLLAECKKDQIVTPVCVAVERFTFRESQINATGIDFSKHF